VSQVLSWRHWAKFCVSHGGFGAMAPAPLTSVTFFIDVITPLWLKSIRLNTSSSSDVFFFAG